MKRRVFENTVDKYCLPFDTPVELHVVDEDEFKRYLKYVKEDNTY